MGGVTVALRRQPFFCRSAPRSQRQRACFSLLLREPYLHDYALALMEWRHRHATALFAELYRDLERYLARRHLPSHRLEPRGCFARPRFAAGLPGAIVRRRARRLAEGPLSRASSAPGATAGTWASAARNRILEPRRARPSKCSSVSSADIFSARADDTSWLIEIPSRRANSRARS